MDHIGIDVHKKESQLCTLGEGGTVVDIKSLLGRVPWGLADNARPA